MASSVKRKAATHLKTSKKPKSNARETGKKPVEIDAPGSPGDPESSSELNSDEEAHKIESGSEDELDELDSEIKKNPGDEFEAFDDGEIELSEAEEGQADETPRVSASAVKRQEQKKLQKERKLQKAHGQQVEDIKKLWERLREKHGVSKNEREKLVLEIMKLVDGHWKELVFRHDASRVVQTVFKYGDKALRQNITQALKGTYVALAKSAYGKYLLVKMMHYGSAKTRAEIIDEMHGSFRKLMGHKEGAYVLEDCYREYATAKQRRQIMREFYGSEFALFKNAGDDKANLKEIIAANPDKRPYLLENLNKVITQAINKGSIGFEIVHAMMLEYIRNIDRNPKSLARETFIDLIADEFVEMVHTNAGSQVASLALAISTAKERKRLLKSLRQFPLKLAKDNYGNIVLMSAFLTVDDTKLTHKAFAELESDLTEVMCDRYARRPLLLLLVGPNNTKYFGAVQQRFKEINEFKEEFSKKDDEQRRQELLENFSPAMNSTVVEHLKELVKETLGMQFILELLSNEKAREPKSVEALIKAFEPDPSISKAHPLNINPISGRVAKLLVRVIPEFRDGIANAVMKHPVPWSTGEGSFAVIALLETLDKPEKAKLVKTLAKLKSTITNSDAKGKELLTQLIKDGSAGE